MLLVQRRPMKGVDTSLIERSSIPKTEEEKKILSILEYLEKQRVGFRNVPLEDGRLLRLLTEAVGAKYVVEIGTSNGYSTIWFCMALWKTDGYLDYLNKFLSLVRSGGLVLSNNMNSPPLDLKFIKAITTNPDLETIFLHMYGPGIGVTLKKR